MKAQGLPATLRAAVARLCADVPSTELSRRASRQSNAYRARAGSEAIKGGEDIAAYLTARLPATYAAMAAALAAVAGRAPAFAPKSLLDAGAGPGTASWAAAEAWPSLAKVTMLDRNPALLRTAKMLAEDCAALKAARFVEGDIAAEHPSADLVLAGYALAELGEPARKRAVEALWSACEGVLVLVEPGTPDGFARILEARTLLARLGARIAAPCPGDYACPIQAPDWCHFAVRLPRLRAHLRAKGASVPFEDEKFSYLAVAREGMALTPVASRILARPHVTKPGVQLRVCAEGAISERWTLKRDKDAYRALSKKGWGDAL